MLGSRVFVCLFGVFVCLFGDTNKLTLASLVDQELMFDLEVLGEDFHCLSQKYLKDWIYFMLRQFNLSEPPTEVCLVLLQGT